jgi:uncharacterized alkaline shock family protein YloU
MRAGQKKCCDDLLGAVSNPGDSPQGFAIAKRMSSFQEIGNSRECQMTQPVVSRTGEQAPPATSTNASPATRDRLSTGEGQISVAESVVQKIAGKACRELGGVHAMGTSGSRAFGTIRERIPGSTGPNFAQGVGVEVGETEAAIDLDIVVEYGVSIAELGRSLQRNVKQAVERMTGLRVVEVNIAVDDVHLPGDGDQDTDSRVS